MTDVSKEKSISLENIFFIMLFFAATSKEKKSKEKIQT